MKRSQSQKSRKPYDPYVWVQARARLFCNLGEHDVDAGDWVRYRRGDYRQLACCERCLATHGIHRQARPFVFVGDTEDVKARQSGGDE